jgi:hypothetical protein
MKDGTLPPNLILTPHPPFSGLKSQARPRAASSLGVQPEDAEGAVTACSLLPPQEVVFSSLLNSAVHSLCLLLTTCPTQKIRTCFFLPTCMKWALRARARLHCLSPSVERPRFTLSLRLLFTSYLLSRASFWFSLSFPTQQVDASMRNVI